MEEDKVVGTVRFDAARKTWVAKHRGQTGSYSEARFGAAAKRFAEQALLAMRAGTYDPDREALLLRHTYSIEDAAKSLGLHVSELRRWILNGSVRGKEVLPPKRDSQGRVCDRFSGYELAQARERLQGITW